jgi:PAS domain S-box-containing protein
VASDHSACSPQYRRHRKNRAGSSNSFHASIPLPTDLRTNSGEPPLPKPAGVSDDPAQSASQIAEIQAQRPGKADNGLANHPIARVIGPASDHSRLIGPRSIDRDGIMNRPSGRMRGLERLWEPRSRTLVLTASGVILLAIASLDWWTKPYVSLGFLYLFPIMLAAGFLPRWAIGLLGVTCAVLAELFSSLGTSVTRLSLEALALAGCGLFVAELVRNRRITLKTQEKLRALVETSPAAIVTVDERGCIELANEAAIQSMAPRNGHLVGDPISAFLPELHHALRWEEAPQFRTSMQCLGHRGNGETFMADVWFSTYKEGTSPKLAAIIGDMTEETSQDTEPIASENQVRILLNPRELDVLRLLVQGLANKEIAARLAISESAVKNSLQQLFMKNGVRTRSQLVRVALERHRNLL